MKSTVTFLLAKQHATGKEWQQLPSLKNYSYKFWKIIRQIFFTGVEIKVPRQHLINPDAIQIYKELGTGEFGVVQQGVWIDEDQETHQVAIKSLSKERMQNSTMEFMKEYEIMQTIQHENIVRYYHILFVKLKQQFFFPWDHYYLKILLF